ncbi:MAG: gamma carbonic anhydrase family protein [Thermus sp.]|uniref:gamma carbonic anhydrase family protein n=1 Tax=Thermus sp. TaxID=275 RepID=UPI0025D89C4A|nr:gamma carbonic anhydrase family protein [Thermus sp.]MCS6869545.1 gamma carbonic anhydrase family protein [Thermus sp.]MCS7217551.1 gamma carbonic anhydrase family protein [Thermus sp.]MCX7850537.1 gamma carbonic anhydrase family protein [Thermus sp.]MDW8018070.1 gamma carbonic anhydrase family protein [Thermus sp.]MDW8358256.1 gamma carbonic anhydrase family protein [Thermus sp.]
MSVYRFEEKTPRVHPTAFLAPGAYLVGEVEVGEGASIWFGAVVRGDLERVVVGPGTNVQDGAVLHADPGFPCLLGPGVTVGHRAVVHGAVVEEGALIGMGAVVLNGARIGKGAVVGAGAVVPPGMEVPEGMLALGVPARVKGPATPPGNAPRYQALAERYRKGLSPVEPPRRYRLTLRGQDALNPFSELHLSLKRGRKEALEALRRAAQGFPLAEEEAAFLLAQGLLQPE